MKYGNGEYIPLWWDGMLPDYELVRGHVTREVAMEVLDREGMPTEHCASEVEHGYGRWIPKRHADIDMEFRPCEAGPGAFPVTFVEYV